MNHDDVLTAIEAAQWDFEPELSIPGVYEIRTDVLCLRRSETSTSPLANKVVKSVFTENVDRRIEEVFSGYQAYKKPFSWWVGPNSRPTDLRNRLERRGMHVEDEYVGLAFRIEEYTPHAVKSDWVVEEAVSHEQLRGHASVSSVVWTLDPASTETAVKERSRYVDFSQRRGGYLVVRDGQKYVENASYRVSTDGQTMYLIGGAVLPEYRGQGVYRAMLEYRLEMAKQQGCVLATTQARVGTSEPILRRFGFVENGRFFMMVTESRQRWRHSMMKVAVFTDVHGNSSALRAVLDEIDQDGHIEHIFCLGDMIGIGPETNEVLEMLFSRDDVSMTLGNHEIDALSILDGKDPGSRGEEREHQEWIAKRLDSGYTKRLRLLPLALMPMFYGQKLMMLHYHLHTNGRFYGIDQEPSGDKLDLWYKGCQASAVCFGHHHPIHFFKTADRTYVNPGSLGCCGRPTARYAVLSIKDDDSVDVELRDVEYDNRMFLALYKKLDVPARDFILKAFHGNQTP